MIKGVGIKRRPKAKEGCCQVRVECEAEVNVKGLRLNESVQATGLICNLHNVNVVR